MEVEKYLKGEKNKVWKNKCERDIELELDNFKTQWFLRAVEDFRDFTRTSASSQSKTSWTVTNEFLQSRIWKKIFILLVFRKKPHKPTRVLKVGQFDIQTPEANHWLIKMVWWWEGEMDGLITFWRPTFFHQDYGQSIFFLLGCKENPKASFGMDDLGEIG